MIKNAIPRPTNTEHVYHESGMQPGEKYEQESESPIEGARKHYALISLKQTWRGLKSGLGKTLDAANYISQGGFIKNKWARAAWNVATPIVASLATGGFAGGVYLGLAGANILRQVIKNKGLKGSKESIATLALSASLASFGLDAATTFGIRGALAARGAYKAYKQGGDANVALAQALGSLAVGQGVHTETVQSVAGWVGENLNPVSTAEAATLLQHAPINPSIPTAPVPLTAPVESLSSTPIIGNPEVHQTTPQVSVQPRLPDWGAGGEYGAIAGMNHSTQPPVYPGQHHSGTIDNNPGNANAAGWNAKPDELQVNHEESSSYLLSRMSDAVKGWFTGTPQPQEKFATEPADPWANAASENGAREGMGGHPAQPLPHPGQNPWSYLSNNGSAEEYLTKQSATTSAYERVGYENGEDPITNETTSLRVDLGSSVLKTLYSEYGGEAKVRELFGGGASLTVDDPRTGFYKTYDSYNKIVQDGELWRIHAGTELTIHNPTHTGVVVPQTQESPTVSPPAREYINKIDTNGMRVSGTGAGGEFGARTAAYGESITPFSDSLKKSPYPSDFLPKLELVTNPTQQPSVTEQQPVVLESNKTQQSPEIPEAQTINNLEQQASKNPLVDPVIYNEVVGTPEVKITSMLEHMGNNMQSASYRGGNLVYTYFEGDSGTKANAVILSPTEIYEWVETHPEDERSLIMTNIADTLRDMSGIKTPEVLAQFEIKLQRLVGGLHR